MPSTFSDSILRLAMRTLQQLRRSLWFFTRPRTCGAHAVALTPGGAIILVKLRYASGWRLPGGGVEEGEAPEDAVLRELREEIGMTAHGAVQLAAELEETPDFKRDLMTLFIVRDVLYQPPRWSLEIEETREFSLDRLPSDLSPRTSAWLGSVRPNLS